jgi:hypothetical protein
MPKFHVADIVVTLRFYKVLSLLHNNEKKREG